MRRQKCPASRNSGYAFERSTRQVHSVRQLESLDAWRRSLELAQDAYRLTLHPHLRRHFALIDQIRRAAISIPANVAEGYALSTTPQFIRATRISLGSAAELYTHLSVLEGLALIDQSETHEVIALTKQTLALLVGLLKALSRRSASPFPFPDSRFPTRASPQ